MKGRRPALRAQDPEGVRRNILAIATDEFANKGYSGARVDDIAARTSTSKRMIYYYFGDKERLFIEVLEQAYGRIRQIEAALELAHWSRKPRCGRWSDSHSTIRTPMRHLSGW